MISQIPNLPTDNLYKFIALFGLVLFLIAGSYPFIDDREFKQSAMAIMESLTIIKAEKDYIAEETDYLLKLQKSKVDFRILDSLNQKIQLERRENNQRLAQTIAKKDTLERHLKYWNPLLIASYVITVIGASLIYLGFHLWYKKVQKPLDQLLLKELNKI